MSRGGDSDSSGPASSTPPTRGWCWTGPVKPPVYMWSRSYKPHTIAFTIDQSWGWGIVKISMEASGLARLDGRTYTGLDNAHTYMIILWGGYRVEVEATHPRYTATIATGSG